MFELDARLQADTLVLGDLPLSKVLLMNDQRYPWIILVPRRADIREAFHLSENDQQQLAKESSWLSEKLADHFQAYSMNVAALGNVVAQLHVHHVVRMQDDPAWPAPVWGHSPVQLYSEELADARVKELQQLLDARLLDETALAEQSMHETNEDHSIYW